MQAGNLLLAMLLTGAALTFAFAAVERQRLLADDRLSVQAALLDQARDAIIVRGVDHRILFWNKSAERRCRI